MTGCALAAVRTGCYTLSVVPVLLRARALVRRYAAATVLLGILVGVGAGMALGAWSVARRTSSALPRYVHGIDAPTAGVTLCPPGVSWDEARADRTVVSTRCFPYPATADELAPRRARRRPS
jgi:hypothetical protein